MVRSINDFKSSFSKDVARPSRFDVNIPIPLTLLPYVASSRRLNYRCENANLPGKTLATTELKIGSSPTEKYPYQTTFNDIDFTFIVDDDMNQKLFFDAWINYINPSYNYNFKYKGDYVSTITVNQYNVSNELTYSVDLYDAFPISINQMDLDWSSDGYHKLNVTFAYTQWRNNSLQNLALEVVESGIDSISNAFGGLGGTSTGAITTGVDTLKNAISNFNFKPPFI